MDEQEVPALPGELWAGEATIASPPQWDGDVRWRGTIDDKWFLVAWCHTMPGPVVRTWEMRNGYWWWYVASADAVPLALTAWALSERSRAEKSEALLGPVRDAARAWLRWDPVGHGDACAHRHCEGCDDDAESCDEPGAVCTCSRMDEDGLRVALRAIGVDP